MELRSELFATVGYLKTSPSSPRTGSSDPSQYSIVRQGQILLLWIKFTNVSIDAADLTALYPTYNFSTADYLLRISNNVNTYVTLILESVKANLGIGFLDIRGVGCKAIVKMVDVDLNVNGGTTTAGVGTDPFAVIRLYDTTVGATDSDLLLLATDCDLSTKDIESYHAAPTNESIPFVTAKGGSDEFIVQRCRLGMRRSTGMSPLMYLGDGK